MVETFNYYLKLISLLYLGAYTTDAFNTQQPHALLHEHHHHLRLPANINNRYDVFCYTCNINPSNTHVKQRMTSNDNEQEGIARQMMGDGISSLPIQQSSSISKTEELQLRLQIETLSRIILPAILFSSICYATLPQIVLTLTTLIHDAFDGASTNYGAEALQLILTDNSNQFIQNAHNALSLLFTIFTGYTFSFMAKQQERVYVAMFEEVNAATCLLEQVALLAEGRKDLYRILLQSIDKYIQDDLKVATDYATYQCDGFDDDDDEHHVGAKGDSFLGLWQKGVTVANREDMPALMLSDYPKDDPLETILYVTSVGEPSIIYPTVKQLRQARAKRLGALQRKMPEINIQLLYVLGFLVWVSFPIVATGAQTVGGLELLNVFKTQLSVGIFAMCILFGIINELKQPQIASAYNVDYSLMGTLVDGLEKHLATRLLTCEESPTSNNIKEER